MKKILLILFVILFSSVYTFAASSDARKIEKKLGEYNDVDFKNYFKSYCIDFQETTKSSYIDRYYNILMSSGTDEEVYGFVNGCIINGRGIDNIYFNKIIEDNYSKLIRKYYRYFFINRQNAKEYYLWYNEENSLKIFYNQLNQSDIKTYCNYITSNAYIINPKSYKILDILREKISNEDMKKISLKINKDIKIYEKQVYNELQYLKNVVVESGLKYIPTIEFLDKYYKVDIKDSVIQKYTKMYYYNTLTENYPKLAQSISKYIKLPPVVNNDYYSDFKRMIMLESGMEIHHEDADVTYVYKLKTPLKLNGIFTLSNINNNVYTSDSKYLNKYLPKTEFSSYDKNFELMGMSISPRKITYGSNIYPNILSLGILGEVNFDAEITINPDDKIMLSRNPDENRIDIYVDEVKLNKIISSVKYYKNEYKDERHNIDTYKLTSSDGYVNVRNSPNGKVIKKINLNSSGDYIVYYYKGLYKFKDLAYYPYNEKSSSKSYNHYYNKINKLLNMKNLKIGNWYKVVYFPKNTYKIDDAVIGYIHSSQMEKIRSSKEYLNEY